MLGGEPELAREEAEAAVQWARSDACRPDEREWLAQLEEALAEATAAAAAETTMATD